jgi:hypothetical protein
LQGHVGPNDVVLTHLHFYKEPLSFYYQGPVVAPFGSRLSSFEEVENGLEPYLGADVLWLVQSGTDYTDPDRLLESWLSEHYPLVTGQYPNRIVLKGFLLNPGQSPPLPGTENIDVTFDNASLVAGAKIDADTLSPTDLWLHPPSNWLHVTLYATPGNFQLTLEDSSGGIWGRNLPLDERVLQTNPDQITRIDYDINLNPDTPPGSYKVVLRAIDSQGFSTRQDNGESYLILYTVTITH